MLLFSISSAVVLWGQSSQNCAADITAETGSIKIEIIAGENFENRGWFFIFPFKKGPQMAAWVEDKNGRYMGTIFASQKTADQKWIQAPENGRPESLPVWTARSGGVLDPVDAVAAASSDISENTGIESRLKLAPGKYRVYLEVNSSYDWNSVWKKKLPESSQYYNGVNGQPSLVYRAEIETGRGAGSVKMEKLGTGDVQGRNGSITESFDGIDSSLTILESVSVFSR